MKKKIALILCLVLVCGCFAAVLSACEPAMSGGIVIDGLVVKNTNPLKITSAKYVLRVSDFPDYEYIGTEEKNYSDLTVDYSIYNPTDSPYKLTAFVPAFVCDYDYSYGLNVATDHAVYLNGAPAETVERYTYGNEYAYSALNPVDELNKLSDVERWWGDINADTAVYKYEFALSGENSETRICCKTAKSDVVFFDQGARFESDGKEGYSYEFTVKSGEKINVYSVENELYDLDGKLEIVNKNGSETSVLTFIERQVMSFEDFVCRAYDADSGISRTDWYNAVIYRLQSSSVSYYFGKSFFDIREYVNKWYQLEVDVAAGQTVACRITAPVFPERRFVKGVNAYRYEFDLQHLTQFSSCSEVEIQVVTEYFKVGNGAFTAYDGGYKAEISSLSGNAQLTLSKKEVSVSDNDISDSGSNFVRNFGIAFAVLFLVFFILPAVIIAIVFGVRRKKKKNQQSDIK